MAYALVWAWRSNELVWGTTAAGCGWLTWPMSPLVMLYCCMLLPKVIALSFIISSRGPKGVKTAVSESPNRLDILIF